MTENKQPGLQALLNHPELKERDLIVVASTVVGSHLWGTTTEDSDEDVRFIYREAEIGDFMRSKRESVSLKLPGVKDAVQGTHVSTAVDRCMIGTAYNLLPCFTGLSWPNVVQFDMLDNAGWQYSEPGWNHYCVTRNAGNPFISRQMFRRMWAGFSAMMRLVRRVQKEKSERDSSIDFVDVVSHKERKTLEEAVRGVMIIRRMLHDVVDYQGSVVWGAYRRKTPYHPFALSEEEKAFLVGIKTGMIGFTESELRFSHEASEVRRRLGEIEASDPHTERPFLSPFKVEMREKADREQINANLYAWIRYTYYDR